MNTTWLGQSGYLLVNRGQRLVIDPYFSDIGERKEGFRRLMSPPCSIADLSPDAAELKPHLAIPMHYGMFGENTADPSDFIAACVPHDRPAVALEYGHEVNSRRLLSAIPTQSSTT
jgi:L-ascorbate metabolism protein UlaG (beta-lactamase superfamily)